MQYDEQLRLSALFETSEDGEAICVERLSYGESDQSFANHNQCGQLIRHDDPAGTQLFTEFGLNAAALVQTRYFLRDLAMPDWPESITDRERMLEPGDGAKTRSHFNAPGEAIQQTDAKGHRQFFSQTLDGQLRAVRLQLSGEPTAKTLVSAIHYTAHGQTGREVAGNGVITTLEYDAQNGRLTLLQALRSDQALQKLHYAYDPVGNVLSIEDATLPIRYFANQRVEPVSRYCYDTLYQLIEATGWEAGTANKGPSFSTFDDPSPVANYRQRYRYDQGGNLLELIHEGPQQHGHRLVAAAHSNRCLPVLAGVEPDEADFRHGFDANGNLLNLQPGQALNWDPRNQLREVRPVERDSGLDDYERYVYGADGLRVRKVRSLQTNARTLISEIRYLPNLELRSHSGTGEVLQVISVQAGRSSVRVLHWESTPPKDSANDQCRYSLNDHLGSCTLELDDAGEVISQERYHPFGTTAWFAGRGEVEASFKTVRYSGKERDATGLYYYGFRYYVPWLQRWINPDPAGGIDGPNRYRAMRNNTLIYLDRDGRVADEAIPITRPDRIYYEMAEQNLVHPLQAAGMQPIRNYFADSSDPNVQAYRSEIPIALAELAAQDNSRLMNTHHAHVIAAARTNTASPSGALLYHSGEALSSAMNMIIGEAPTSRVMGPLSVAFNSPVEDPQLLAARRNAVATTFGVVGKMMLRARHPLARVVGASSVAMGNTMNVSEAQTVVQYKMLGSQVMPVLSKPLESVLVPSVEHMVTAHQKLVLSESEIPIVAASSTMVQQLFAAAFPGSTINLDPHDGHSVLLGEPLRQAF
ncbi:MULTISPECIES: RHS repeat domain-containing protein [unclassified Pseudomonas]|uniref:RHS repeat-associated core domain-containing protein n=1 Tax=Pseudomonas sp. MYb327 TaxID=2745230 RepID=A0AAU8E2L6_9PSED